MKFGKMSEHRIGIGYEVSLEGAEESVEQVTGLLTDVSKGIGLVSSFDYTLMAWQRTAERADIMGFMRATLSTINLLRQLIRATELATIAQTAYNAALAIGKALEGPTGWIALGVAAGVGLGGAAISTRRPRPPLRPRTEENRRDEYRSVVPG